MALTLALLAAPFGLRWMDNAEAFAPQVAQRGDVASMSVAERAVLRAEAAFFEGQDQVSPEDSDDNPLDVALAAPVEREALAPQPAIAGPVVPRLARPVTYMPPVQTRVVTYSPPPPTAIFLDDVQTARLEPPKADSEEIPSEAAAVETPEQPAAAPEQVDVASAAEPEPSPEATLIRVEMTVPPRMTPFPLASPRQSERRDVEVASLGDANDLQLPIDVTPPLPTAPTSVDIEEAPLPPLSEQPRTVQPTVLAMADTTRDLEIATDALPEVTVNQAPPAQPTISPPAAATPPAEAKGPKITNGPRIALVIAAAGLNKNVTRFAIEALPAGVTLAFAPVRAEARVLAQEAKDDGHTILVEIPMEPISKARDPGRLTLRSADTAAQNLARLDEALARIPVADGASSYLGARFNAVEGAAAPIMAALAKRDLFFFENEPTARSVLGTLARRQGMSYAQGIVKFDRDRSGNAIRAALDALEKEARQKGSAVGVGTALRGTISTVALWAKEAEKRGVRLVPIIELQQ